MILKLENVCKELVRANQNKEVDEAMNLTVDNIVTGKKRQRVEEIPEKNADHIHRDKMVRMMEEQRKNNERIKKIFF